MGVQLFGWTFRRRTTYWRRSGFRVEERTATRIVLRTQNWGLLLGGIVFLLAGLGMGWVAYTVAWSRGDRPAFIVIVIFAVLVAGLGALIVFASRTQRDRIVVDRGRGVLRIERAKKRKRPGEKLFIVQERPLAEIRGLEIRSHEPPPGCVELCFVCRGGGTLRVDFATDRRQLVSLGQELAAVAGLELVERG